MEIAKGMSGARWRLAESATGRDLDPAAVARFAREIGEPEVVARCLLQRSIQDPAQARRFLAPHFPGHLHDPWLLRDMSRAVERLHRALRDQQRILIVTDFDVDGTTSSVILTQTMRLLGAGERVSAYIPDRFSEGYGLSTQIVERAAKEGYHLILTADIGIKSHIEARRARELGIDLIICDHHLPDGEEIPEAAYAVLCPKGASGIGYPNKHLAACGVALKLASALLDKHPRREVMTASLAKLAAIGTIADLVDLGEVENRAIVTEGLQGLGQRIHNPGLRALFAVSQVGDPVTTYDIGFKIGPRINAAGRIAHANSVLALFDAQTEEEALTFAQRLDELNAERQAIQRQLVDRLTQRLGDVEGPLDPILLFEGDESEGYHRGVVGIACSKVVEMTGRPTLICAINEEGMAHGSARSIDGFHLVEALDSVADLLVKYGGHPMAAGFTVPAEKIPEMRRRLCEYTAGCLEAEQLGRLLRADAELSLAEVDLTLARSLSRLEPHGIGNPSPLFLLRGATVDAIAVLKEAHLKLSLRRDPAGGGGGTVPALWWNAAAYASQIEKGRRLDLLVRVEVNVWGNRETCQLKIVDASLSPLSLNEMGES
jgi:single-stranded-DNA-specific exonuclease